MTGLSKKVFINHKAILILLIYVFLSFIWSYDKISTLKASMFLFLSTILLMGLLYKNQLRNSAYALKNYFLTVVFLSSIFYFVGIGQMGEPYPGVLNGIFPHKNILGRVCAIGVIFFGCYWYSYRKNKDILYLLFCFAFLILSESKGAISILVISIIVFFLVYNSYKGSLIKKIASITIIVSSFILISYVLTNAEVILELLGKDITLTGRTFLWDLALEYLRDQYIFGYGYDVFWTSVIDYNKLTAYEIYWEAPHAHNGYLDLLLDVGFIGLLLYLYCNIKLIKDGMNAIKKSGSNGKALLLFSVLTLIYLLVSSFVEKSYFQYNDIQWCFFIFSSFFIDEIKRT
ncbi:O-antigen ligase family protein [Photobacterium sp. DA100]|uniref:O-antigen ligase family protein n=1 Tax=Photobacterium sp. DA100 TaxID=3027472 RepID=UPI0024783607|nr:O-antigen ligase family protein [Photobacterium sp. DA100]WEM41574.1 O-antigen ligase family protein [Photobacterium sp. DA100]